MHLYPGVYVPVEMYGGEEACWRKPKTSTTASDLVLQLTSGTLGPDYPEMHQESTDSWLAQARMTRS